MADEQKPEPKLGKPGRRRGNNGSLYGDFVELPAKPEHKKANPSPRNKSKGDR